MHSFLIAVFLMSVFSYAIPVSAAACPPGTKADIEDGKFYDRGVECTPQAGDAGAGSDSVQSDRTDNTRAGTVESGGRTDNTKPPSGPIVTLLNPLGAGTNLAKLVNDILGFVVRVGAIVVTFMLIYVGYKFVVARGDPTKITEAKNNLLWTIVGALILLGAQAIAMGIEQTVRALSGGG